MKVTNNSRKNRVVFDTNVFVPAVAELEEEHAAWGAMVRICDSLVVSEEILKEYGNVIREYGFNQWILMLKGEELKGMQKFVEVEIGMQLESDDSLGVPEKDMPFLKAAIASGAKYIVTKDSRHFLSKKEEINANYGIEVLTPKEYYDICEAVKND